MRFTKGYIDKDLVFYRGESEDEPVKRSVWDLLRAQEHVRVRFVLDASVSRGEAWCVDERMGVPAWRAHPEDIELWLTDGAIDWRPNFITPEDFYAA